MVSGFIENVEKTVDEFSMLECSSVVVGFSGGADSSALLDVLHTLCKRRGIALHAIHVNHMIRGEEALRDERYCVEFCRTRDIPLGVERVDVPALAKKMSLGIEECARKVRYECFAGYCASYGIEKIATAHNINDNRETVIFNMLRGCGIRGLCGIPPVRDNIIRPLLFCTREQIVEYCRNAGINYVTDSSNNEDEYTRNRIRHHIASEMDKISPDSSASIMRMSSVMREELEALEFSARFFASKSYAELRELPVSLLSKVLVIKMEEAGFKTKGLEEKHIRALCRLFIDGKTGDRLSLPGKCCAVKERNGLMYCTESRFASDKDVPPADYITPVPISLSLGENYIPSLNCYIDIFKENDCQKKFEKNKKVYKKVVNTELFYDIINFDKPLYVRGYIPGDRYRYGKMLRRVSKLLWALSMPEVLRQRYPVICDGDGPVWLPGYPVKDGLMEKSREKYIVNIYLI